MAVHLDHFSISSPNMVYGAHRLRLESTLSFYDGGHFPTGGHANRYSPTADALPLRPSRCCVLTMTAWRSPVRRCMRARSPQRAAA
jgi:hypothetical protein